MQPTRPQGVPEDASIIYPGQDFPPGNGVQAATLRNIEAVIAQQNARTMLNWSNAERDWQTNAQIYQSLGMKVPPEPQKPPQEILHVVYADLSGTVIPEPEGASGKYYAWVWQTQG